MDLEPPTHAHDWTALYRLFSEDGTLLYVGITMNPQRRWQQHAATKPWWPEVASRAVHWIKTREQAETAEASAILAEHPKYNRRGVAFTGDLSAVLAAREEYQRARKDALLLIEKARVELGGAIYRARQQGTLQGDIANDLGLQREQVRRLESEYREKADLSEIEKS